MKLKYILLAVSLVVSVGSARAISFSDSGGGAAVFTISGDTLTVTLSDSKAVSHNGDVLTALFFDLTGNPTLTPGSATASGQFLGWSPFNSDVGGEWRYQGGGGVLAYGASEGISSTGLGVFGPKPNFNGTDLNNNAGGNIAGGDFGIVGHGSQVGHGFISEPVIDNQVVFTLTGASGLSDADIKNVTFQYGTALGSTVPDQGLTAALLGLGMLGMAAFRRLVCC